MGRQVGAGGGAAHTLVFTPRLRWKPPILLAPPGVVLRLPSEARREDEGAWRGGRSRQGCVSQGLSGAPGGRPQEGRDAAAGRTPGRAACARPAAPAHQALCSVCRAFLLAHPEERARLWEVEPPGAWGQRGSIWLKVRLQQAALSDPGSA